MNADAANGFLPVDDGNFLAHLGRTDRALLARRAAPNHDQVIFVGFHIVPLAE